MLVMLKRDFLAANGVLYLKSRDKTPTPLPNSLKGKLPKDAVVADEQHDQDDPAVVYKKGNLVQFLKGEVNPVQDYREADIGRTQAEAAATATGQVDKVLAENRARFAAQLASEKGSRKPK